MKRCRTECDVNFVGDPKLDAARFIHVVLLRAQIEALRSREVVRTA